MNAYDDRDGLQFQARVLARNCGFEVRNTGQLLPRQPAHRHRRCARTCRKPQVARSALANTDPPRVVYIFGAHANAGTWHSSHSPMKSGRPRAPRSNVHQPGMACRAHPVRPLALSVRAEGAPRLGLFLSLFRRLFLSLFLGFLLRSNGPGAPKRRACAQRQYNRRHITRLLQEVTSCCHSQVSPMKAKESRLLRGFDHTQGRELG